MNSKSHFVIVPILLLIVSCSQINNSTNTQTTSNTPTLKFESISSESSGIDFTNKLDINKMKHPIEYVNIYNGGGVSVGDINNDGLPDIYLTGNLENNKLYLNKGNFEFEDITAKAGVACQGLWSTGATMADVNNDGFLDLYVCQAYFDEAMGRENKLFINNGDLTFSEKGKEMGVNDSGYSITASFFDYNKDGHLDLVVGNHPTRRQQPIVYHNKIWQNPVHEFSDHLYKNNGDGTFTDVSKEAGIFNYGWTLGIVTSDLNHDGWTDVYVAVDHSEPDRFYLNKKDGTFEEVSEKNMKHISLSSMGIDAADINNDGLVDLTVMEMLSRDNFREKTKMASMDPNKFWTYVNVGYHYQYMRNMLHLNTGGGAFSEIGQLADIQRTDWSWAALLADFDNDGWKDLYVANGYYREFLDKDHNKKFDKKAKEAKQKGLPSDQLLKEWLETAPATRVENNFFKNNGDLTFSEMAAKVGVNHKGYSTGAAYADFDNDGDLDLIVNNIDDPASLYKNTTMDQGGRHYLQLQLAHNQSTPPNGTKITLESASGLQYQEMSYTRGFQSSVDGIIHFGLGSDDAIKKLTIEWPDGKTQVLQNVSVDQLLIAKYEEANSLPASASYDNALFENTTSKTAIDRKHEEVYFDDYSKQILLPHQMSQFGPFFAQGDVNGDNLEDFFVGGGNGQAGMVFLQNQGGTFSSKSPDSFKKDTDSDDLGATFFDADGDQDLDLYVVSGGNEFELESTFYRDRLYLNDGSGNFSKAENALPDIRTSGSCVKPFDFDGDGDQDLFIGGRHVPGKYPAPAYSYLLENQGGTFKDISSQKAPELNSLGLVTDAVWTDFDQNGSEDLIIVGEWMAPTFLAQTDGKFENKTAELGFEGQIGWWFSIELGDIDNDGDEDFVLGNLGKNYKYSARPDKPFHVYAEDFDQSGTYDIALGYFLESDVLYPVRGRQCSSEQMPSIAEKFPTYEEFGKASIFEVYGEGLNNALHYEATNFSSSILVNNGDGSFDLKALPNMAQIAPTNAILLEDLDNDQNLDLLIAGNLFTSEVETGRADAGKGLFLKGLGDGNFLPILPQKSGLILDKDVKDMAIITSGGKKIILVANNNEALEVWQWRATAQNEILGLK